MATVQKVYEDAVTRCSFVLELAPNGEIEADRSEMAVGAIVEGDDGAFIAVEVGISVQGRPFALIRVFDRDGTATEPSIISLPTGAMVMA